MGGVDGLGQKGTCSTLYLPQKSKPAICRFFYKNVPIWISLFLPQMHVTFGRETISLPSPALRPLLVSSACPRAGTQVDSGLSCWHWCQSLHQFLKGVHRTSVLAVIRFTKYRTRLQHSEGSKQNQATLAACLRCWHVRIMVCVSGEAEQEAQVKPSGKSEWFIRLFHLLPRHY